MKTLSQSPTAGEIIEEMYLKPISMSVEDAAILCNIPPTTLSAIIDNEQVITYELAYKLSKGFNTSHKFWLSLQNTE